MMSAVAKPTALLLQAEPLLLQMQQAIAAGNWLAVQALDRQLSSLVAQAKQQAGGQLWSVELQLLRQRYQSLLQQTARQQKILEQKMQRFRDNKAGVLGYQLTLDAQSSEDLFTTMQPERA